MTNEKKLEEIAFNKRYSRFKVQIYFKNRPAITHYGQERYGCSVAQIKFKHVTKFALDKAKGLQDCEDRILLCSKLYNGYTTATIYDRLKKTVLPDGSIQKGREVRKYVAGELVEAEENIFNGPTVIFCDVLHKNINGASSWELIPTESTKTLADINFKTEVQNALTKPKQNN